MNRIGLKNASKQCLQDTSSSPVKVTLIYLVILYVINILENAVTNGPITGIFNMLYSSDSDLAALQNLVANSSRIGLVNLLSILIGFVTTIFGYGFILYCLRLSRGTAQGFSDITEALPVSAKIVWLTIIMDVFIFLWSLLFIIPGIVAAYRYRMAPFVLMDNPQLTAREALNISKRITQGHKMDLFLLDLSFIGWHLLCAMTLGILYIWKLPYIETTYAHAYNWMVSLDQAGSYQPPVDDQDDNGPEII